MVAKPEYPPLRVEQSYVDKLEADCDRFLERLEKLRSFILPGGTPGAALLHQALHGRPPGRALARGRRSRPRHRAGDGGMNPLTATYLNRLSDLLFILARVRQPRAGGDVLWQPGGGRVEKPRATDPAADLGDVDVEARAAGLQPGPHARCRPPA